MERRVFLAGTGAVLLAAPLAAEAQQAGKVYRVGVVLEGGPYYAMIEGLRGGLKELGFEEGRQYILHIRDVKGDPKALEETARALEQEKVDLIYSLATSVTLAVKRATASVPIVFYVGTDPVVVGLVKSYAKPGGRLTGVHSLTTELDGKRLQILKEMSPKIRRVAAFYDPGNASARESAKLVGEAARQLRIEVVERHVRSVEELRAGLQALKPGEVDALAHVADAMVTSQTKLVVDTAKARKLPTISNERSFASDGGLVSYGVNNFAVGRQSAKYVHRVLLGTSPADLPVERADRFELIINLKTAKALGLTIPQSLLLRADEVIQ
jgi:putative tryptophan/tyrosine transport system substrate-binding protein